MSIDKLAVWVHPLFSPIDLGKGIVDMWERNLLSFARDQSYCLIVTGCHETQFGCREWNNRIYPVLEKLPVIFGERYLIWKEGYFVNARDKRQVSKLCTHFNLPQVKYAGWSIPRQNCSGKPGLTGWTRKLAIVLMSSMKKSHGFVKKCITG